MTTASWLDDVVELAVREGAIVRVVVAESEGSTPREAGAPMLVLRDRTIGTIGGGVLEHQAILRARRMLDAPSGEPWRRELWSLPLGPALGQCCGGRVTLLAELYERTQLAEEQEPGGDGADKTDPARSRLSLRSAGKPELSTEKTQARATGLVVRPAASGSAPTVVRRRKTVGPWPVRVQRVLDDMLSGARPAGTVLVKDGRDNPVWLIEPEASARQPLFLYGAGHVGRALVKVLTDLPFDVTWIDTAADRFPDQPAPGVERLVTTDPASAVSVAPPGAFHLVMTYSHPLDLGVCHAVLGRGDAGYLGLIGSEAKRARFVKRLVDLGHRPEMVAERLHCPIGLPDLPGKAPAVIAVSVAADLVRRLASREASLAHARSGEA